MTINELTLEEGWKEAEPIVLNTVKDVLSMPQNLPSGPGLYKLTFADQTVYVGETNNLQRRIGEYVLYYLSSAVENEFRINRALKTNNGARVSYYVGDDFQTRSDRCVAEHRLITEAGKRARNGGTIEDRISFYASEILRLTEKLKQRSAPKESL